MNGPAVPASSQTPAAPGDGRVAAALFPRVAAALYDGVLLFGVVVATATVYALLAHQTSGIEKRSGLLAACFVTIGLYFIVMWTRGGQTLAEKTWHLRVVAESGAPLGPWRALARYLAAWLWFLPPLALAHAFGPHTVAADLGIPATWYVLYPLAALLHPRRQFLHDVLCRTAIVVAPPVRPLPR